MESNLKESSRASDTICAAKKDSFIKWFWLVMMIYGHLGMERTLRLLQERFFWPKMAENVHTHKHTCERCLRFKQPQERAEIQPILVSYLMELIHLDFLTLEGKAGDAKSTNILVKTDHFTKYAQAYITPKQMAIVVAHTLWENFLVHYGWQRKYLLIKENLSKIICFENCVVWLKWRSCALVLTILRLMVNVNISTPPWSVCWELYQPMPKRTGRSG